MMTRTVRRHRAAAGRIQGSGAGRCYRPRMSRVRVLVLCLFGMLATALTLGLSLSTYEHSDDLQSDDSLHFRQPDLVRDKMNHKPRRPTVAQVRRLVSLVNGGRLWYSHLRPLLVERLPGTRGSRTARQHIYSQLEFLSAGWSLDVDSFSSLTPKGPTRFSNVLAVLDPAAPRRLLLACHYDSKDLPPASKTPHGPLRRFLGASDSAVSCAMMLELVTALDTHLRVLKQQMSQVTLQLVFFDGEEAFGERTSSDCLYGSRHLAEQMSRTPHPPGAKNTTLIQALDLFVLLDLIGAPDPSFISHFDNTLRWFDGLISIERRLHQLGLLTSHPREQSYFRKDFQLEPVDDDHLPFLQRGVPVLHLIATPFPSFMHTVEDALENVHASTVENLTRVLAVFLAEYLGL